MNELKTINTDCAKSSEHEPLHRLTAAGSRPRRLGAVANGWEPPPAAGSRCQRLGTVPDGCESRRDGGGILR